jgi:hypothetical protein
MSRSRFIAPMLLSLTMCTPASLTTPEGLSGAAGGGGEISGACTADFGTQKAAQRVETFLVATSKFTGTAAELEASLLETCKNMGKALDMSDEDYEAKSPDEPAVRATCGAVSAKLGAELSDLKASGNLQAKVVATPPRCEVNMNAYADCAAKCEVDVDPGKLELDCKGGEIVGKCSGECRGECHAKVDGQCSGACEGTCSGGCSGICQGACDGECKTKGADGQCNGECKGTCEGSCSAGCQGSCSGECAVKGDASCEGECHGGCSVAYTEPRCTGTVEPPKMDADCKASCDAKINAEAECTPGHAELSVTGDVKSNIQPKVERVSKAVRIGFGNLMAIREKLERLQASGSLMVSTARDVPGAAVDLGAGASACVLEAAAAIPRAVAQVGVSVDVSVSLSASVSGEAGARAGR